jgi:hypothetical protein
LCAIIRTDDGGQLLAVPLDDPTNGERTFVISGSEVAVSAPPFAVARHSTDGAAQALHDVFLREDGMYGEAYFREEADSKSLASVAWWVPLGPGEEARIREALALLSHPATPAR